MRIGWDGDSLPLKFGIVKAVGCFCDGEFDIEKG